MNKEVKEKLFNELADWIVDKELTDEQADYIGVPKEGPYKPDHYRY